MMMITTDDHDDIQSNKSQFERRSYLSMREDSRDVKASGAFDIHEKAIGALNQPLKLVLGLFLGR